MTTNIILTLCFFAAVLAIYYMVPQKFRWIILGVSSICFYGSASFQMLGLMAGTVLLSWIMGIFMDRAEETSKKICYYGTLAVVLGSLFVFKYYDFFIDSIGKVLTFGGFKVSLPTLRLAAPLGISYYTFKIISYVTDCYKGVMKPERHLGYYGVSILFFPQILCGPIQRPKDLLPQIAKGGTYQEERFVHGMERILLGLFKKAVIADRLAVYVNTVYGSPLEYPGLASVLATFFYAIQIYCDFSGYSEIAIGMSELFGLSCQENFQFPYFSQNIKEFWNRWHISLSSWLKDYIYIPLGGNRRGVWKKRRNLLLTFLVSGLWHGSSWNFVIWGAIHGIWNMCSNPVKEESVSLGRKIFRGILTFCGVTLSWIFFRASDLKTAITILHHGIFDFSISIGVITQTLLPFTGDNTCAAFFLTVGLMILLLFFYELGRVQEKKTGRFWFPVMLAAVILFGQFAGSSFLYAQF